MRNGIGKAAIFLPPALAGAAAALILDDGRSAAGDVCGRGGASAADVYIASAVEGRPRDHDAHFGTKGRDLLVGTEHSDCIRGLSGADNLGGGAGSDLLLGDGGDDYIFGDGGHDALFGGDGLDILMGGSGNDLLVPGAGFNYVFGYVGDDLLWAGPGSDVLVGGPGNDYILGGVGDDSISGGAGNDVIDAGPGSDRVDFGPGTDLVYGGKGDDDFMIFHACEVGSGTRIDGGEGFDTLRAPLTADELRARGLRLSSIEKFVTINGSDRETCVFDESRYLDVTVRVEPILRSRTVLQARLLIEAVHYGAPGVAVGDHLLLVRPVASHVAAMDVSRPSRWRAFLRILDARPGAPTFVELDVGGPNPFVETPPFLRLGTSGHLPAPLARETESFARGD